MIRQQESPRNPNKAMNSPETDPVAYPDLTKFKQRTVNFQKTVWRSLIPSVLEDNTHTQTINTGTTNDSEQATELEQFHHLMKHHGQELVDYILTLHQHNNDALDLNEEITSLVDQHEAMQNNLEAIRQIWLAPVSTPRNWVKNWPRRKDNWETHMWRGRILSQDPSTGGVPNHLLELNGLTHLSSLTVWVQPLKPGLRK